MTRRTMRSLGWMTILMLAFAAPALADSHGAKGKGGGKDKGKSTASGPSAETRARMAESHEKLAACLRSTRPISECHAEMEKAHHEAGHVCDCSHCEHGEGKCTGDGKGHGSCERGHHGKGHEGEHGEGHGSHGKGTGKGTGKGGSTPAPAPNATPTPSGATQ